MKKDKLLICLSTLLLLLVVGGCNEVNEEVNTSSSEYTPSKIGPASLIEKIHQNCNYTVTLEYDLYRSSKTITYADYKSGNYDLDDINNSSYLDFSTLTNILYTENTLEMDYYLLVGNTYEYQSTTIYVNDNGTCWQYIYPWNEVYWNYYYGDGVWSDYCYSLDSFYSYDIGNYFTYEGLTAFNGIECEGYSYSSLYSSYLFLGIGTDFLYGQEAELEATNFTHYLTYYFDQYQEMIINFNYKDKWFYEGDLNDNTILFRGDYEIYADIYNIGNTDDTYAYYVHDALQSQIEKQ